MSTPSPPEDPPPPLPLLIAKHTKYLARSLNVMPSHARKDCTPLYHFMIPPLVKAICFFHYNTVREKLALVFDIEDCTCDFYICPFSSFDTSRMTIAFFGLCGLDILGSSDLIADQKDR